MFRTSDVVIEQYLVLLLLARLGSWESILLDVGLQKKEWWAVPIIIMMLRH